MGVALGTSISQGSATSKVQVPWACRGVESDSVHTGAAVPGCAHCPLRWELLPVPSMPVEVKAAVEGALLEAGADHPALTRAHP